MDRNSKWSNPGQTPQDQPDLVARVFKMKKDELIHDLTTGGIFGQTLAFLWDIEFQKRGLPHAHILTIMADEDRPKTSDQVDQIVSTELPPSPYELGIFEEEKILRKPLWDIVLSNMIHGPCGAQNPGAPCMENNKCTKNFPKPFQLATMVDEESSHPIYRRRSPTDGGLTFVKNGKIIDNS